MKISFRPKSNGKGFEFYGYDSEKGRGNKRLTQKDYPQLTNITTEQEAIDFRNWWNQRHDEEQRKLRSKRNQELRTKDFDFADALAAFTEEQKKVNKQHLVCVQSVEEILNILIHTRHKTHPANFDLDDYTQALTTIAEREGLKAATIKKRREAFNKFLKVCRQQKKIDFNQYHPIPADALRDVNAALNNKHSATSIKRFAAPTSATTTKTTEMMSWNFEQLRAFDDFAQKHDDPMFRTVGRIAYCGAMLSLRRSGYIPLVHANICEETEGRLYCRPTHTIQKRQGDDGGIIWEVGDPDPVKPLPKFGVPIWEVRTERYMREFLSDTKSQWLFPDPNGWTPNKVEGKLAAGKVFFHPERLTDIFDKLVAQAGLSRLKLKNLRHTGINIIRNVRQYTRRTDLAQMIAGHQKQRTTENFYVDEVNTIEGTDFSDLWAARAVFLEKYGA